jgi:Ribbon-helix-helix protein, copG family
MQTLVLRIPDDLARELDAEAKKTQLTKSEVVRRRLIAAGSQRQAEASGFDLIVDLVGTVEGGPADMSGRKKEYLKTTNYGKSHHR